MARCVLGVEERVGHGFTDAPATRKMHREFAAAEIDARHVLRDPPGTVEETVHLVEDAAHRGLLRYPSGQ